MGHSIDTQYRQNLRKNGITHLDLADLKAAKGLHKEKADQCVQTDDGIVTAVVVIQANLFVPIVPSKSIHTRLEHQEQR